MQGFMGKPHVIGVQNQVKLHTKKTSNPTEN